jgi:hypothetical protein
VYLERKEDLAIYYWLVDKFATTPFVKIVDGFPGEDLTIPTISVEQDELENKPFQLGDRKGSSVRTWYIDVFAKNKSQRDEFAYKVYNDLMDGITVYDIVNGNLTSDEIGHLDIEYRKIQIVRIDPELVTMLYYRATITILAENVILGD